MSIKTLRNTPINRGSLAGHNIALLYVSGESYGEGATIASSYAAKRNVPTGNIAAITVPGWSDPIASSSNLSNANAVTMVDNIITALETQIGGDIKCICLCGFWPATATNADASTDTMASILRAPYHYSTYGSAAYGTPDPVSPPFMDWHYPLSVNWSLSRPTGTAKSRRWAYHIQYSDSPWQAVSNTEWKVGTTYNNGDYVITRSQFDAYQKSWLCSGSGVATTAPTTSDTDNSTDGGITWILQNYLVSFSPSNELNILPDNRMSILAENYSSDESNWKRRVTYYVMGLAAPYVESGWYAGITSPADIVDRMVDDAIAVEAQSYTDIPGTAVLIAGYHAVGIGTTSSAVDAELSALSKSMTQYNINLDNEAGNWDTTDYIPSADSLPATATILTPGLNGTFVNIPDVFIHSLGLDTYFSTQNSLPIKDTEISYRQGAIATSSQSCGLHRGVGYSVDYYNQDVNFPTDTSRDIKSLGNYSYTLGLTFGVNVSSVTVPNALIIAYSGGSVVATSEITAINQWTLTDDSGPIVVTVGANATLDEIITALRAQMATGWTATWIGCGMIESRGARQILNGAAVVYGTTIEPGAGSPDSTTGLVYGLYQGKAMAEIQPDILPAAAFETVLGQKFLPLLYGDPLYRPLAGISNS